ncbi:MAG TPA: response regulator [Bryobacteraceae bacterium]|nr:response regulator [Bryobacteraceae bacterium]
MAKILVVEDQDSMREWLIAVLEGAGHQVSAARDGLSAISLATRCAFDLVFTDISMPEEEGLGMILAVRKVRPELKIIVISGTDPEVLMDAKILGAYAALRKPVTSEVVLRCVRELP